jgi:hypothetical protein
MKEDHKGKAVKKLFHDKATAVPIAAKAKQCIRLIHKNGYGETYYLVATKMDARRPNITLISATTMDKEASKCFESVGDAAKVLVECGEPTGWTVLVEELS